MKQLMKLLGAAVVALTVAIPTCSLTGCAVFDGTNSTTTQRVASGCKIAVYVGTAEYLAKHPEAAPQFAAAANALFVLENSDTLDAATLLAVVNQLPIKQLDSPRAQIIITAATIVLTDYAGSLPVDQIGNLKPIAKALREGIELGLPVKP